MILRFCSGSMTPASLDRKRSLASTTRRSALNASRNSDSTCAASPSLCRPVSTKMQVSRWPIARSTSAAATDESTPPDRPHTARPVAPTRAATAATASPTKPAIVHDRLAAADAKQEVRQDLAAARRVRDLGVELHAPELARRRRHRRRRAVGALADDVEAGGQRLDAVAVAHPHRDLLAGGEAVEQIARRRSTFTVARPYSRRSRRDDLAAELAARSAARRSRCPASARPGRRPRG